MAIEIAGFLFAFHIFFQPISYLKKSFQSIEIISQKYIRTEFLVFKMTTLVGVTDFSTLLSFFDVGK